MLKNYSIIILMVERRDIMNGDLILSFTANIMLLMSLAVIYSIFPYETKIKDIYIKILMGLLVAVIGVSIMYNNFEIMDGLHFDARAVAISVSAMFLGVIPTLIGGFIMILYRIYLGGYGVITGVLWVIVAGALGLGWRFFRLKNPRFDKYKITWIELYLVGFFIQLVMITLLLSLPNNLGFEVIGIVSFSLLVVFPIGSLVISQFMLIQRLRFFQHINTIFSEKQYKKLFSDNHAIIFLIDPIDGSFVDVNQSAIDKYKYTKEEFLTMNVSNISLNTFEKSKSVFAEILKKNISDHHFKHITKDKVEIDVEIYSGPMVIDNKEYILSTLFDITEKLQKEQEFKDVDSKLRATLLSVGEGIVVTDKDHNITLINKKAMEILGVSKEPINQSICNVFRIHSNSSDTSFHDLFHSCIIDDKIFNSDVTYSLIRNDNNLETFVDFSISPIKLDGKNNSGAILVIRDETIEEERKQQIRYISQHDYLTKLHNRSYFEEHIKRLDTSRQLPLTIIMGDVNGLKLLNDAFSHVEGDKLLIEIANILKKAVRQEDILARWGGDEFAILLPQTSSLDSVKVYDRIKDLCNKSMYETIKPSISLGFATKISPDENISDIIKLAEEKMYHEKLLEGKNMRNSLVDALEKRLYEKSDESRSHSDNLVTYVDILGNELSINEEGINVLKQTARLHDIGLVGIDKKILVKPGPLNENEWDRVKAHPEIGSRIVQSISELQHISKDILHHHEWYDGTGYPQGLKGKEIPYFSRIISVIDAYDVMISGRIYKEKMTNSEAIEEIEKYSGTQFDPEIVTCFIKVFKG
jgi:diguanylate cyclase (GGDEF)-like protein/PAS domain S-box-containing protein